MGRIVSARPLYLQIRQQLRNEIFSGSTPPGARLGTEAELMARFDVSRATVRKALGGLADEGLVRRVPGGGTFVRNRQKRTGASRSRSGHVAIQGVDLHTTLTDSAKELVRGAAAGLESLGMTVGVFLYDPDDDEAHGNLIFQQALVDERVDGVISMQFVGRQRYLQLQEAGVPAVLTFHWDGMDLPAAFVDNFAGYSNLTGLALEAGWRAPALVKGPEPYRADELARIDRPLVGLRAVEGFRQALARHGMPFYPSHVLCSNFRPEDVGQVAEPLRRLDPPPDVLLVDGAEIGVALWEALGHAFPVVCLAPRKALAEICTVHLPLFEVGRKAGEMLNERIEDPSASVRQESFTADWDEARAAVLAFRRRWGEERGM